MDTLNDDIDINDKLYGINNRRAKKLKLKTPKKKYALHRFLALRGCYRTLVRLSMIDDNYATPSLEK